MVHQEVLFVQVPEWPCFERILKSPIVVLPKSDKTLHLWKMVMHTSSFESVTYIRVSQQFLELVLVEVDTSNFWSSIPKATASTALGNPVSLCSAVLHALSHRTQPHDIFEIA